MITPSHSITNKTLLTVGGISGFILVIATLLIYGAALLNGKAEALKSLEGYGQLVAGRENPRFERLSRAHSQAVTEFKAALTGQGDGRVLSQEDAALFDTLFPLKDDGTRRSTQALFDGVTLSSGQYVSGIVAYIRDGSALSDLRKQELLAAFFAILRHGEEVTWRVKNLLYVNVHTDMILYLPEQLDQMRFVREYAANDLDVAEQIQFAAIMPENNPEAQTRCISLFDREGAAVAFQDSIGCYVPVYYDEGKFLGAFASNIYFSKVYGSRYEHALSERFEVGIVDADGHLIVPPPFAAAEQFDAQFQKIQSFGTPVFDWIAETLELNGGGFEPKFLRGMDPSGTYLVASQMIALPQWHMLFFIKHDLIVSEARKTAFQFFAGCLIVLLVVSLVVAIALRIRVGAPLDAFIIETRRLARSVNASALDMPRGELPIQRNDEIGVLARSFDAMAKIVSEAHCNLQTKVEQRTSELTAQKVTAEHANRAKTRFVASMSHELRTPLNAIMGFAEMLREEVPTALSVEAESHVEHLMMSAEHLRNLVEDVLEYARLDAGVIDIQCSSIELFECIDKAKYLTQLQARAASVEVKLTADEEKPTYVEAEAMRVVQVIVNLLSNAIKYGSQPGTVTITVSQGHDATTRLEVRDTGPGVPFEQVDRVFEPFERHVHSTTAQQGAGIGLSLCKSLVQLMNGRIGVTPAPEGGSIFWVELTTCEAPGPQGRAAGKVLQHAD